jgi:hypothetical protein
MDSLGGKPGGSLLNVLRRLDLGKVKLGVRCNIVDDLSAGGPVLVRAVNRVRIAVNEILYSN